MSMHARERDPVSPTKPSRTNQPIPRPLDTHRRWWQASICSRMRATFSSMAAHCASTSPQRASKVPTKPCSSSA